jgi:hypothetical protein
MINDFKEDSNISLNEVRRSIADLDNKVTNMGEKFSKETKIVKNKQAEKLERKSSINQIDNIIDNMISRQDQAKERIKV